MDKTIAQRFHDSFYVQTLLDDIIFDLFEEFEPNIYNDPDFDFTVSSDEYDNSIIIIFDHTKSGILNAPYRPNIEIVNRIKSLGFSYIYWIFKNENGPSEKIRGNQEREICK